MIYGRFQPGMHPKTHTASPVEESGENPGPQTGFEKEGRK